MDSSELPTTDVSATFTLFTELPVDVARYILETAAYMDRATALRLVVVSKTVFEWIDPILYRVVVLSSVKSTNSFATAIQTRGPESFARNVKTLVFDGVTSLTWWTRDNEIPLYARPNTPNLFLTHLHLFEQYSLTTHFIPRSLTHLSVSLRIETSLGTNSLVQIRARCPRLTHICVAYAMIINENSFAEDVNVLLKAIPPTVKVFAMRFSNRHPEQTWLEDFLAKVKDPRFVPIRASLDVGADWSANAYPDLDIWEFAEHHLRSKALKEINRFRGATRRRRHLPLLLNEHRISAHCIPQNSQLMLYGIFWKQRPTWDEPQRTSWF